MDRKDFLFKAGLLAGGSLLFRNKALASFTSPFEYNVRMLRHNVGIFTERGGTIGFMLTKEGAVVIDSQFADTAAHLLDEVNKRSTQPVQLLLNTHHHGDHSSGNIVFKNIVKNVIAHTNSAANQLAAAEKAKSVDKQLFPNKTFTKKLKLKLGGEKIRGYYFGAGHTNGDAVYHLEGANVMHVGDLLFNKRHPFVDRSTGANMRNWITALDKIQKVGDRETIYIFGHSLTPGEETGTAENLKAFQDYLSKVLAFAEAEFKRGISKEAFIKNTAIPGVTAWSGGGIERPLTAAYEEVSSGPLSPGGGT